MAARHRTGGIVVAGQEPGYDAFISYSHRLDATIAARLQSELQRFAKPWYRMRALHVFRDQTSLAASPHLWTTIEQALADSRWLILMASPESALALAISRDGRWLGSEDAGGIHVSRISGSGQPGGPARAFPGAEPIFDTSLGFLGHSDSRLVSASGDLLTLWNLNQYSRIGAAARIRMPWRCGQVCPGPRLAISPDGREAVISDSNGDLLMAAGLNGAFGKITKLASGSTQAYGYPEWVPGAHRSPPSSHGAMFR